MFGDIFLGLKVHYLTQVNSDLWRDLWTDLNLTLFNTGTILHWFVCWLSFFTVGIVLWTDTLVDVNYIYFECNMISFPDFAKPRFATFVKYGKTELVPPTPGEIPQAIAQATRLVQSGITFRWTQLSVRVRIMAVLTQIRTPLGTRKFKAINYETSRGSKSNDNLLTRPLPLLLLDTCKTAVSYPSFIFLESYRLCRSMNDWEAINWAPLHYFTVSNTDQNYLKVSLLCIRQLVI